MYRLIVILHPINPLDVVLHLNEGNAILSCALANFIGKINGALVENNYGKLAAIFRNAIILYQTHSIKYLIAYEYSKYIGL